MARSFRGLAVVAALAVCAPEATATPLPPGGTVAGQAPGNVLATFSGTVVAVTPFQDSTFIVSGANGLTSGYVSSAVVKTSAPGLDFVYQVNVSAGTVDGISISSFHNLTTDISQTADRSSLANTDQFLSGTIPIASYTRSPTVGDSINVTFSGSGVGAEQASYLIVVHTDSPTYAPSSVSLNISGAGLIDVPAIAPVPEPGSLALWLGSFGGVSCVLAWRQRHIARTAA